MNTTPAALQLLMNTNVPPPLCLDCYAAAVVVVPHGRPNKTNVTENPDVAVSVKAGIKTQKSEGLLSL